MISLARFKIKILIVLIFCAFMTFSVLVYVMKITEKCENDSFGLCVYVSKNSLFKTRYVLYKIHENATFSSNYLLESPFQFSLQMKKFKTTTKAIFVPHNTNSNNVLSTLITKNHSQRIYPLTNYSSGTHKPIILSFGFTEEVFHDYIKNNTIKAAQFKQSSSYFKVYEERKKQLRKFCRKYFKGDDILQVKKFRLDHVLIDEKHKILYCYVPKVACTNWKRIFLFLMGKVSSKDLDTFPSRKVHFKNLYKSIDNYTVAEVLKLTQKYTKFIFVRHPFERLLSAYRNKLEQHYDSSKYFQARFGKYIIKKFRKNPTNVSLTKGDDVTFSEFVSYLLSSNPNFYNEHWQKMTDLCHPCLINYDFIGKYETLVEDSNFLLRYIGTNLSFPILHKPSTTRSNLKKYYNTLSKSVIYKLYSIYEMDFRLFGYDLFNVTDWKNSG